MLWTVISVIWFVRLLGGKYHNRKDTIIDYILAPPALCVALAIGCFGWVAKMFIYWRDK